MSKNLELKYVLNYLKSENIKIDFKEFVFQVESHPDYPSLLSYSDALVFFNIENTAFQVNEFKKEEFPENFMVILKNVDSQKNELSYVQLLDDGVLVNGERKPLEELKERWGEIVLIAEQNSIIIETKRKSDFIKWGGRLFFISFVLFAIFGKTFSLELYAFLFISICGLFFSAETFKQSMGMKSSLSEGFCKSIQNADCFSVINSEKWFFFKRIPLSEIALVFFAGQALSLYFLSFLDLQKTFFLLHFYCLWLIIPISLISIYFQWKVEKQWCPLCLSIIVILYLELLFINLFPMEMNFSFNGLILFIALNLFILSVWLLIRNLIIKNKELNQKNIESLRFKKNYKLFKKVLNQEPVLENTSENYAFILGNQDAILKINLVTNPLCGYCKDAHKIIDEILKKYSNEVKIILRFTFDPYTIGVNKDNLYLHRALAQQYINFGEEFFLKALNNWFENKDIKTWRNLFELNIDEPFIDNMLTMQYVWCENNNMFFTPSFAINNIRYPDLYKREDLLFFMRDLLFDNQST